MSGVTIGLLGLAGLFALLMLRTPVGMALLAVGFFGIAVLNGLHPAMATMLSTTYSLSANATLAIIPLFVLMGNVASAAGFSRKLFDAAYALVGGLRGGLASAAVIGCAGFSAVSGSSIATAITMGRVALPEMRRFGYRPTLATGTIAAGGTLGILIPPSAGLVIYGVLTEQSIGRLFIAGILPGLLLMTLFIAVVTVISKLHEVPLRDVGVLRGKRLRALGEAAPLVVVILVSIGGIYLGVFTPTEAAGVAAFMISAIAVIGGFLRPGQLIPVLVESVRTTAMLFFIIIGASVFGPFLALSQIPDAFAAGLAALDFGRYGTLILILATYVVLGTFLEGFSMLVITLPIVFPVMTQLGFDPIWFGVLIVLMLEMGLITPPVGLNVFAVKGVAEDVPMGQIFIGVLPFWLAMVVCAAILIAFPEISLYLPSTMYG